MNKRRTYVNESDAINRKHVEFAKNLFVSWDDDGSGLLEPHEIIKPLISMGLSSDHNFARKIL
jgi:Ca2+-binding EF-hand superfamily protein